MFASVDHTPTAPRAMRELTAEDAAGVSGGAYDIEFDLFGLTFIFRGGDGWDVGCVANSQSYGCVTTVGGQTYTSSGPRP